MMQRVAAIKVPVEMLMSSSLALLPHGTRLLDISLDRRLNVLTCTVEHWSLNEVPEGAPIPTATVEIQTVSRYVQT